VYKNLQILTVDKELSDQQIRDLAPCVPVSILRPDSLTETTKGFCEAFPGDVLYAMKCNPDPVVLKAIRKGGVSRFDAASIQEVRTIARLFPEAVIYYMNPIKAPEMIREAYVHHGVRAFVLDCYDELEKILIATNYANDLELYVRIAVPKGNVVTDFSAKFGARPDVAVELLAETGKYATRLGVSFHVGTQCINPEAYANAIDQAADVIKCSGANVSVLDVGGGFPTTLDENNPPPLMIFYGAVIAEAIKRNGLESLQLLCEAGRGLVADAGALIVRVEGRRDNLLYINDGTYGGMLEASNVAGLAYPCRLISCMEREVSNDLKPFCFAGPTCDSIDMMNGPFILPADIRTGDWIKLEKLGAYSEVSRTCFNGFETIQKVIVTKHTKKVLRKHAA
jgi:ornithine decarboxylase